VANIKSQIKRNRQTIVIHERNKAVRSELSSRIKVAITAAGQRRRRGTGARGSEPHRPRRSSGRAAQEHRCAP